MVESTRPLGASESDDGGTDGTRGPVPPPSVRGASASLFTALLRDRSDEGLLGRALRARVELRVPHGLLLVCGPDCDPAAVARRIAGRVPRAVVVPGGDAVPRHVAVVVPTPAPALWSAALTVAEAEAVAHTALVLPRAPVLGLRTLRATCFAALSDASLAVALDCTGPLIGAELLVVPRMLAALPEADQNMMLAPLRPILDLQPHHRSAYIRTLEALHRHGGTVPQAAEHLHVHPNTVRYRVSRFEEMTGLRLDNPSHRLHIDLAATLVRLRGWPPAFGDFGISARQQHDPEEAYRACAA